MRKTDLPIMRWACFFRHSRIPSMREQADGAFAWALEGGCLPRAKRSSIDDLRNLEHTTRWGDDKLPRKSRLFKRIQKTEGFQHVVFFATPLCLALSKKHAEESVPRILESGVWIYIHKHGRLFTKLNQVDELCAAVVLESNSTRSRASLMRKLGD